MLLCCASVSSLYVGNSIRLRPFDMKGLKMPNPLIVALAIRSLSLLLPQTFFQPDEFYQALEPAHHLVFGYGHLTWEWKDLSVGGGEGWWGDVIERGRMRNWLWPSLFAGVYQLLKLMRLDETNLIVRYLAHQRHKARVTEQRPV